MRAEDLFNAFDELDAELLYDAHAKPQRQQYAVHRFAIAAAFVLLIAVSFIIYGIFVSPTSYIYFDSQETITVTLNSRGRVLSVKGSTEKLPAVSGKRCDEAAEELIAAMVDNGSIKASENTLIIGADNLPEADRNALFTASSETLAQYEFDTAVIEIKCHNSSPQNTSPSVSRMIELLCESDSSLDPNNLSRLSANDLAILWADRGLSNPDITVNGVASDSGHIGFENATAKALVMSDFKQADIDSIQLSYSVYHGRLIYIVRVKCAEKSEAYFINAETGTTEQVIKTPTEKAEEAIEQEIRSSVEPSPPKSVDPTQASDSVKTVPTTANIERPTDANSTDETKASIQSAPTQPQTEAESNTYSSLTITMKELSFVVQEVPDSAVLIEHKALFEGQCFNTRNGEKQNTGSVAVITTWSALQKYLSDNAYPYVDKDGNSPSAGIDRSFFKDHSIIAVSGVFSDASYYACLTDIRINGSDLYAEASLSYGESRSGEFYCRALTLYGIDKNLIQSTDNIIVY